MEEKDLAIRKEKRSKEEGGGDKEEDRNGRKKSVHKQLRFFPAEVIIMSLSPPLFVPPLFVPPLFVPPLFIPPLFVPPLFVPPLFVPPIRYLLLGTHQLPLNAFEASLRFLGETDIDIDEVQCIVANLIDKVSSVYGVDLQCTSIASFPSLPRFFVFFGLHSV